MTNSSYLSPLIFNFYMGFVFFTFRFFAFHSFGWISLFSNYYSFCNSTNHNSSSERPWWPWPLILSALKVKHLSALSRSCVKKTNGEYLRSLRLSVLESFDIWKLIKFLNEIISHLWKCLTKYDFPLLLTVSVFNQWKACWLSVDHHTP